jgi:hypothetical protein
VCLALEEYFLFAQEVLVYWNDTLDAQVEHFQLQNQLDAIHQRTKTKQAPQN